MKPLVKAILIMFVVLLFVSAAAAQSPYASLPLTREPNREGTMDYVLRPNIPEILKRFGDNKPYRIMGVVARPAKEAAVLLFVNAQEELQLDPQTDKRVTITVDAVDIGNLNYELAAKNEHPPISMEIGNVLISLKDLQKIAGASSVVMKMGVVVHQLDKDNLSAIRYMVGEIEKDRATQ